MCGLAGIYKLNGKITPGDIEAVKRMTDAQIHRGPDDSGYYNDDKLAFGHRRLSIIDMSPAGHQPMSNENGRIVIIYNGEIYNFQELRSELKTKHDFKSNSDTEVIIHGYEEWGIDLLLQKLRGMYAFALYDLRDQENNILYLVRDRYGIKPLYYYKDDNSIIFASEVKPMVNCGVGTFEKNDEWKVWFLLLGSLPEPVTTVKNVYSIRSGQYLKIRDNVLNKNIYYDITNYHENRYVDDSASIYDKTRDLLEETVRLHLISDVPLGVFLSGGIDSSALVALASKNLSNPLFTLSIIFDEREYSEQTYQQMIAKKYGTNHHEIKIRSSDFYYEFDKIFTAMDQPSIDGVNTYFISKAAKCVGLTTVLSGTGSDEVLCGYDSFKNIGILKCIQVLPSSMRSLLSLTTRLSGSKQKLSYLNNNDDCSLYLLIRGLLLPSDISRLLDMPERMVYDFIRADHSNSDAKKFSSVNWLSYMEINNYLKNQLLKDTDSMSMCHSIETRVPFLDNRFLEYVFGVHPNIKINNKVPKPLLYFALQDLNIPDSIFFRKKQGFTFPFDTWLKRSDRNFIIEMMKDNDINEQYAKKILCKFYQNKLHWSRLWALIIVAKWQQMHV